VTRPEYIASLISFNDRSFKIPTHYIIFRNDARGHPFLTHQRPICMSLTLLAFTVSRVVFCDTVCQVQKFPLVLFFRANTVFLLPSIKTPTLIFSADERFFNVILSFILFGISSTCLLFNLYMARNLYHHYADFFFLNLFHHFTPSFVRCVVDANTSPTWVRRAAPVSAGNPPVKTKSLAKKLTTKKKVKSKYVPNGCLRCSL
jgi:hypothetical protein